PLRFSWPSTNGPREPFALVRRTLDFCALFLRLQIVPGCNEMSAMVSGCTMSNWRQFAKHGDKPSRSGGVLRLVELGLGKQKKREPDKPAPSLLAEPGTSRGSFALALADAAIEPSQPVAASAARHEAPPFRASLIACAGSSGALPSSIP